MLVCCVFGFIFVGEKCCKQHYIYKRNFVVLHLVLITALEEFLPSRGGGQVLSRKPFSLFFYSFTIKISMKIGVAYIPEATTKKKL